MKSLLSRLRLLNVRYVRDHAARTLLFFGVIALSAALIVAVLGTYGSVSGSAQRLAEQVAGNAALEVTGVTDAGLEDNLVATIEQNDSVDAAVPLVQALVVIAGQQVMLYGSDQRARKLSSSLQRAIDDVPKDSAAVPGLWVGPGVAGVTRGGSARVVAMTGTVTDVPIAGVVSGDSAATINHGNLAIAELRLAQQLTGHPGRLDSIFVVADPGIDVDMLRKQLNDRLEGRAYVATPAFRAELASSSTAMAQNVTLLVAMLALVVAMFLVFNTTNMAAGERRAEMSTLRTLGARRGIIMRDFLTESFVIGFLGAVVGSGLGVAMAAVSISRIPSAFLMAVDAKIGFVLPPLAIPIAVVTCVGATLLASGAAAYHVSHVQPIEAIRPPDQTGVTTSTSSAARLARTWGAATAGVLAMGAGVVLSLACQDQKAIGGVMLFLVGVVLVALTATRPIARAVGYASARLGAPGRLAGASVERAPRRTWATTMTVCLAVALGAGTTGSSHNLVAAAGDLVSTLASSDFVVQSAPRDQLPLRPLLPAEVGAQIQRVPGVGRVVPGQFTYAYLPSGRALVQGLSGSSNTPPYQLASESARHALLDGSGAVLSRLFARQHELHVGDTFTLPTPTGAKVLRVADVIDYISDAGLVAISLDHLQQWFSRVGASFYEVMLTPAADRSTVQAELDRIVEVAPLTVHVFTGGEEVAGAEAAVEQTGALAASLQWIVAIVAALALFNTLTLAVVERRRELGILRALGASRKFIGRVILADALGVGLVGGVAGLALGLALQYFYAIVLSNVIALSVRFAFVPLAVVMAVGAVLISLAGALPPARTASRLKIIEAIGYE
jgi:putative ABC transport system permease protein